MPLIGIGAPGLHELLIVAFVLVLLFGGRKLPELMGGFGKGLREMRRGVREIQEEGEEED